MRGFRQGTKLSKADVQRRVDAYNRKIEEYNKLSLDELKELYPTLRGAYREACIAVTREKLDFERIRLAKEESNKLSETDNSKELPEDTEHNPSLKE